MIQFKNQSITVFQSTLFQTTCSVIEGNDFVLVVDPNWLPNEIEEIQNHIARVLGERELYLLFTHGDYDHIIGYKAFPDAKVIGSKGLQDDPNKQEKLRQINQFDNDFYIKRPYPIQYPVVNIVIEEDGQQLVIGDTTITFYLSPGHTNDGLFTIIEPLGVWIAGDYLSDFERPFIEYSAKWYANTLQKAQHILQKHAISILVPGHGQAAWSLDEMKRRITMSQSYLSRLIEAVGKGDSYTMTALENEMPFPSDFTRQCHAKNIEIIRRDYFTS